MKMNHKNGKDFNPLDNQLFLEEQLFLTQRSLFIAKSVKEIQFLQNKLKFLKMKMKEVRNRG